MGVQDAVLLKLTELLRSGVDVHRCAAASALGRILDPRSVEVLVEALLDEDPDVRTDAATALAERPDLRAADPLMENLLGDPCAEVKISAIKTLTALRYQPVVPWLRRIVLDRDPEIAWDDSELYSGGWDDWVDIQIRAIESLAEFGDTDAVNDIVSAMEDEMGQDLMEVGFAALARLGEPGVVAAAGYLASADETSRLRVVKHLAAVDTPAAQRAVTDALGDRSPKVRLAAAQGLAARDATDHRLLALFHDDEPMIRAEVAILCGKLFPDQLLTLLTDPSEEVRRAVMTVLSECPGCLDAGAVVHILTETLAGDGTNTAAAAQALAAVAPDTAFGHLARLAMDQRKGTQAREGALKALLNLRDPGRVQVVTGLVADDERSIRLQALAGLARMAGSEKDDRAVASLLAALRGELVPMPEGEGVSEVKDPDDREEPEDPATDLLDGTRDESDPPRAAETADGEMAKIDAGPQPPEAPTSTLESILGADSLHLKVVRNTDAKVELSGKDLEFLGLAQRKLRKKRVDPAPRTAPHLDVRRFAARVAGDVSRNDVAEALSELIAAEDRELVSAALDSLTRIAAAKGSFSETVIDALVDVVHGKEPTRRLLALRALGATDAPRARMALRACLGDVDSFLRAESLRALSAHGALDAAQAGAFLNDPDPGVRLAAAETLSKIEEIGSCGELADFVFAFEGYHHREVAKLLRDLAPEETSRRMLDVLDQTDRRREWQVAIKVLEEVNRGPVNLVG